MTILDALEWGSSRLLGDRQVSAQDQARLHLLLGGAGVGTTVGALSFVVSVLTGSHGFEAARRMRALASPMANVPIVAVTASATASEKVRCREAGMDDVVTKPLDSALLGDLLRALLSRRPR